VAQSNCSSVQNNSARAGEQRQGNEELQAGLRDSLWLS
jgi:hypothetical protein